jgi:hypothetical protein
MVSFLLNLDIHIVFVISIEIKDVLALPIPFNINWLSNLHTNESTWLTDSSALQSNQTPFQTTFLVFWALVELYSSVPENVPLVPLSFFLRSKFTF